MAIGATYFTVGSDERVAASDGHQFESNPVQQEVRTSGVGFPSL
jgi:hypothetical protein